MKKLRDSNFELLRIVAIVMVIIHHIFVHVVCFELNDHSVYTNGMMFNNLIFYKRLVLADWALSFGKIANNIFILISGYFLCSKKNIDVGKSIKKILTQVVFVSLIIIFSSFIYGWKLNPNFTAMQEISLINSDYWFIGYYLLIIILGELFINKRIAKLDRGKYKTLLLILFAFISTAFMAGLISGITGHLTTLTTGIFLYLFGGYLKECQPFKNYKWWMFILTILFMFGMMTISYRNLAVSNINTAIKDNVEMINQSFGEYTERSFSCILIAICIFELFSRLKIKSNNIINYIASSTLIIYMLHDNDFARKLWQQIDFIKPYHDNMIGFILMILFNILLVMVLGIIFNAIYNLIMKYVNLIMEEKKN